MTSTLNTNQEKSVALMEMLSKYESLVWYARKEPASDPSWNDVPEEIRIGAFNSMAQIEEHHPDEVDSLKCECCADWNHGFNSGVLAALRWVITAEHHGLAEADDDFPQLDT